MKVEDSWNTGWLKKLRFKKHRRSLEKNIQEAMEELRQQEFRTGGINKDDLRNA